jgi:excisionase family DNA binding protein
MERTVLDEKQREKRVVQRAPKDVEWLTLDEAALEVRLSTKTLQKYINSGELVVARVGRRIRISREELRRFMEKRTERKKRKR